MPHFGEGGKSYFSGKDRAFFFVTYQGVRNPATSTIRSSSWAFLPSEFGRLQANNPGNNVINAITTQSVFALRTSAHPINTATVTLNGQNYLVGQPEYTIATPFTENDYSFRFDVKPGNNDNITFRYLHQSQVFGNSLAQTNGFTGDIPAGSKNFGGNWTHQLSPTMVNDVKAYYQRIGVEFGGGCGNSPGCIPGPSTLEKRLRILGFSRSAAVPCRVLDRQRTCRRVVSERSTRLPTT
jgi:hypothetical protein